MKLKRYDEFITEGYNSQKSLEKLADKIIEKIWNNTYVFRSDDFETIELGDIKYYTDAFIDGFITANRKLIIQICGVEYFGKYTDSKGLYSVEDNAILIKYDGDDAKKFSVDKMKHYFKSTLIHELQHVYDNYLSKGKNVKRNDEINSDKYKEMMGRLADLKEEELDYVSKVYRDYVNLPHEINARFTQAIQYMSQTLSFYGIDWDKSLELNKTFLKIKPFNDVLKKFKGDFVGYKLLSDKDRKRLLTRLGQYYQYEKEFIDMKNNEVK